MYVICVFLSSNHVDRGKKQNLSEFGKLQLPHGHIVNWITRSVGMEEFMCLS